LPRAGAFIIDVALILASWSSLVAVAYFGLFPIARLLGAEELFMLLFDALGSLPSPFRRDPGITNIGALGFGTFLVLAFVGLGYFSFFEHSRGSTPGKLVVGLAVEGEDGRPPSMQTALLRNITKALVFGIPLLIVVDAIFAPFHPTRRRIMEMFAKTSVVHSDAKE
jgi:uncharacterized RDD family membrane protein YckC